MKMLSVLRRPFIYRYYNATIIIIIINVIFFIFKILTPVTTVQLADITARTSALNKYFALIPESVLRDGFIWQIVTYMFMHGDIWHIFLNMLILFMFGIQLERESGSSEFLLYYFSVGVGSGIILTFGYPLLGMSNAVVVGASAAIYGLLLAFATRHPNQPIYIWGILPVKAYVLLIVFTAIEFFSQVLNPASGISHLGHLSGLLVGFLYFLVRYGINPIKEIRRNIRY